MSKNLSLSERFKITKRGYKILNQYCNGLVQGKALSALITSLQPFASLWFFAQIINEIAGTKRINMLILYVVLIIIINFIISLLKNIIDRMTNERESQMWSFFKKVFSDKQMSKDYVDLENAQIQHQKKQAEEDLFMFGNGLGQLVWGIQGIVNAIVNILVSVAMTITLFAAKSGNGIIDSPLWIIVIMLCILFGGICSSKFTVKEHGIFEEWCNESVWFNRMFTFFGQELYMNIERAKDVRIYEQNFIADRLFGNIMNKNKTENKQIFKMSIYPAFASFVIGISNVFCWLFIVIKSYLGAFAVGNIVQYVGVLGRLGEGVQGLMFVLSDNNIYCLHLQDLFDYLDIPNQKYQGTLPVEKQKFYDKGDRDYVIEFRNVSFKYPASEDYALHHISIKIRVGERLAVVGMNGSGKTTFIKLLCRLYEPTEGEILLNGIDIKEYNYNEYMSIFSVVFQDFKLFSYSLGQNVAASVKYDKSLVEATLKKAGFANRLDEMPDGVETWLYKDLDDKGIEISGGEAQKIALARALYKDAPMIVLDEPTAALDPIAEYEIYTTFNEMIGDKTAIYISHRLASCRFCDDIAVFDKGQIIQRGTHTELVEDKTSKYYELWHAQSQHYATSP